MTDAGTLDDAFAAALNADLAALGCKLRIAAAPAAADAVLVVDAQGRELGWVPEHIDASILAAFETILVRCLRRPASFADVDPARQSSG